MSSHRHVRRLVPFGGRAALALIALLGPAPLVVADAATPTAAEIEEKYNTLLDHYCPGKHLEWLSEGDHDLAIQDFRNSLEPSRRSQLDKIADPETTCASTIVGLECGNIAYTRGALELNLLPQLAMKVCSLPLVCRSAANCTEQR